MKKFFYFVLIFNKKKEISFKKFWPNHDSHTDSFIYHCSLEEKVECEWLIDFRPKALVVEPPKPQPRKADVTKQPPTRKRKLRGETNNNNKISKTTAENQPSDILDSILPQVRQKVKIL